MSEAVIAHVEQSDSSRESSPGATAREMLDKPAIGQFGGEPEPQSSRPAKKNWRPPSKWFFKPTEEQTFFERMAAKDQVPAEIRETVTQAEYDARGPVPHEPLLPQHFLILRYALIPVALHTALHYAGYSLHPVAAWFIYFLTMYRFAFAMITYLNAVQKKYGVFDQVNKPRDLAPDQHVNRLTMGVILFLLIRPAIPVFLAYNRYESPLAGVDMWTPVRMIGYTIALDLPFYCYHRMTHELNSLWWVHRLHHGTKHPSVLLSILAGDVQELIEILLCPLIASYLMNMSFAELQVSAVYQLFTEAMGHSGARADLTNPINSVFLKPFGLDIVLEDHDLHHRYGRSGLNFGKQTLVWDTIFGTKGERLETGKPFPYKHTAETQPKAPILMH